MARIMPVEYGNASEAAQEQFEDQIARHGRITNMKKTLLHSIPAFHALMEWYSLRDCVLGFIEERGVNLFCHAISAENNCLVCSTFFRKILADNGDDPDKPVLTDKEQLLVDYGQHCVTDRNGVADELFTRLHTFFTDEQIILLTAFAGLMIATNLINNVLEVDLDEYLESYARR